MYNTHVEKYKEKLEVISIFFQPSLLSRLTIDQLPGPDGKSATPLRPGHPFLPLKQHVQSFSHNTTKICTTFQHFGNKIPKLGIPLKQHTTSEKLQFKMPCIDCCPASTREWRNILLITRLKWYNGKCMAFNKQKH